MTNFEEWRDIEGFEGIYQVSNIGRVRSLDHVRVNKQGEFHFKGRILALSKNHGYPVISFTKNGKTKQYFIHRLVASAFIPNPQGENIVNHIDGNKDNNDVSNLEWCDQRENVNHAVRTGLLPIKYGKDNKTSRKIIQYTLNDEYVATWYGLGEVVRNVKVTRANVNACLIGKRNKAGGYKWKLG